MSKETSTVLLGLLVAIMPFLGFPQAWRNVFYILGGIVIISLGLLLRADHLHRASTQCSLTPAPRRSRKAAPMSDVAPTSAEPVAPDMHN